MWHNNWLFLNAMKTTLLFEPLEPAMLNKKVWQAADKCIVKFSADWSGADQLMSSTFDLLVSRYAGLIKFYSIDVQAYPELGQEFNVQGLPTLIFFYKGRISHIIRGAIAPPTLWDAVEKFFDVE